MVYSDSIKNMISIKEVKENMIIQYMTTFYSKLLSEFNIELWTIVEHLPSFD